MTDTPIYDGTKSVYQLAAEGAYKTKLEYPKQPETPELLKKRGVELTEENVSEIGGAWGAWRAAKDKYATDREAYRDDEARLQAQFRIDLEAEYGMTDHPKAGVLWSKAYEDGHSGGVAEVAAVYGNLIDLVK